jgi:hypothetical protein
MEPGTTATIILASIALIGSVIAHLRIRSRCHVGDVLDISIHKEFEKDLDKYSDKADPKDDHKKSSDDNDSIDSL